MRRYKNPRCATFAIRLSTVHVTGLSRFRVFRTRAHPRARLNLRESRLSAVEARLDF